MPPSQAVWPRTPTASSPGRTSSRISTTPAASSSSCGAASRTACCRSGSAIPIATSTTTSWSPTLGRADPSECYDRGVRWIVAAAVAALAIGTALLLRATERARSAPNRDAAVTRAPPDGGSPISMAVAAGTALRIADKAGPIHVWRPAGYRAETAAIVVYVHGYGTDVDTAWREHHLPEQFALSAVNALFIAPEAPAGARPP